MRRPLILPAALAEAPFATRSALAAGVTPRRLRSLELEAPFHGVRALREASESLLVRCRAYATIMPPWHVFSGVTAAALARLPMPRANERDPRLHVTALDGGRAPRGRGIAGRSTARQLQLVPAAGVPGARMVAPVDVWCELGIRPNVYSRRETFVRLVLVRAGLPEPEPNGRMVLRSGRRTRGDLVFRAYRVLVEYEGEQHLFDVDQWATDVSRLNDLIEDDWRVIRITKGMSRREILERTMRALRDRGWQG